MPTGSVGSSVLGIPTVVVPGPLPAGAAPCPGRRLLESPSDPASATAAITAPPTVRTARPRRHAGRRTGTAESLLGPALLGLTLPVPALALPALLDVAVAGPALGGPALGGPALGGPALGGV
ncbi:hypothetical protein ACWCOX_32220, partial [Micromonospora parva]